MRNAKQERGLGVLAWDGGYIIKSCSDQQSWEKDMQMFSGEEIPAVNQERDKYG